MVSIEKTGYKAIVLIDNQQKTGIGHLMRCIAVTKEALHRHGIYVKFLLNSDSNLDVVRNTGIEFEVLDTCDDTLLISQTARKFQADLIITDSYQYTYDFYRNLQVNIPIVPVMAIDDSGEKAGSPVSGFISFGLTADKSLYPEELLKYSAIGPEFFPLRREFIENGPRNPVPENTVRRILVTMGGSDPEKQTLRIAGLLKGLEQLEAIDIILGPAYGSSGQIEEIIRDDRRFSLYQAPSNMVPLLTGADLVITGGGVTCNELVYLGIPFAVLTLADNQRPMAEAVKRYGCGRPLGYFDSVDDNELETMIKELVKDPQGLSDMSGKCRALIDEKGGARLGQFISDYLHKYHDDRYRASDVIEEYESSASASEEFEKVKWGSQEGMINRYYLGLELIDWTKVGSWLDVGSGTGTFLKEVEKTINIQTFTGLDLSPSLVQYASSLNHLTKNASFLCQSFMDDVRGVSFDLVTCVGVLQKCGVPLRKAVARLAELTSTGGQVFVTTKNLDWSKFKEPDFIPYSGHHWFHLSDIKAAFSLAGLKIIKMEGFQPRTKGVTCSPEESHSVYILAKKEIL